MVYTIAAYHGIGHYIYWRRNKNNVRSSIWP
jgi:hypothetical protein